MKDFILENHGTKLTCYEWRVANPKKVVMIIHGLAEHAVRYDDFAKQLNNKNLSVYSIDLRGHGRSTEDGIGVFHKSSGWEIVVDDISKLYSYVVKQNPDTPIVLFGHSMGSIFSRAVLQKTDDKYEKCVLSGVTISKPGLRDIAPFMASLFPKHKPAKLLDNLTFGDFNKAFVPNRTKFDWLSRDEAQVDKYVEDEKCGFVASGSMFKAVASALLFTLKENNIKSMPKETPIFIISGDRDPAGSFGYDAKYLSDTYKKAGLLVRYKLYNDARHEILNEVNKHEIYDDIKEFVFEG